MAVKLRLTRIGKKKAPFYRIVAIDSRKKRDGAFLENLGTYDALKGNLVAYHDESIKKWLSQGAVPTDSVRRLIKLYNCKGVSVSASIKNSSVSAVAASTDLS